jgi:multidrug efflux pump subunit AcrA (membrane-fusion protein)
MKNSLNPLLFSKNKIIWFRKTRRRNKLFVVLAIIIFFSLLNWIFSSRKTPDFQTDVVKKENIVQVINETGNIKSIGLYDVSSNSTGIVEEIYVQNGDSVVEGQELFKIRATATDQEIQAAYANYLAAKTSLDSANATLHSLQAQMFAAWDKYKELAESSEYENDNGTPKTQARTVPEFHIPEKEWFAAESKYKNQQAVIAQAEAQVNAAWLSYQATQNSTMTSPTAGTVANLSLRLGDSIYAGNPQSALITSTSPKPALTIVNGTENFSVELSLNENDIPKVKVGQEAKIEVDALSDKKFEGIVTHVDTIGTNSNGVITYKVVIDLRGSDPGIRSGMTVGVEIEVDKKEDVLTVASSAVKPYQGGRAVRVYNNRTRQVEFVPVILGIKGEDRTEILKGVSEGNEIIVSLPNEEIRRPGLFGN